MMPAEVIHCLLSAYIACSFGGRLLQQAEVTPSRPPASISISSAIIIKPPASNKQQQRRHQVMEGPGYVRHTTASKCTTTTRLLISAMQTNIAEFVKLLETNHTISTLSTTALHSLYVCIMQEHAALPSFLQLRPVPVWNDRIQNHHPFFSQHEISKRPTSCLPASPHQLSNPTKPPAWDGEANWISSLQQQQIAWDGPGLVAENKGRRFVMKACYVGPLVRIAMRVWG